MHEAGRARAERKGLAGEDFVRAAPLWRDRTVLEDSFAAALIREGFTRYEVRLPARTAILPPRPLALVDPDPPQCYRLLIPIEDWHGERLLIEAGGHRGVITRACAARVHMLATVFATAREALVALEADSATEAPITLVERMLLAGLLVGRSPGELALATRRSPLAIALHTERAIAALAAANAAEAVAVAARRGWLAALRSPRSVVRSRAH